MSFADWWEVLSMEAAEQAVLRRAQIASPPVLQDKDCGQGISAWVTPVAELIHVQVVELMSIQRRRPLAKA